MAIEHKNTLIDGVNIHYVQAGQHNAHQKPTVFFLHGFPEYWETWSAQLKHFSKQYRVIAPDLPGYNLSDKPNELSFFSVPNLVKFFANFIQAVAPNEEVYLVAHDWGGAIAWPLTAFFPHIIQKLVILNAAHPSAFTREMINNPEQRKKSEYIHELIAENAIEKLLANECDYLFNKMMSTMQVNVLTEQKKQDYLQVWRQSGSINGMLQYYRAMPQIAPSLRYSNKSDSKAGPVKDTGDMVIPNIRIDVPTLILWGEQDQAFVRENLLGLEEYVKDCTIKRFPQASHWLQHEYPEQVNENVSVFFER
ncbi:alpha/beta fold hydrolase [Thalassotalea atypica]|uniref:alpha/beta fold hydrolase n=1 Tax=Thalassotalea atypica TaxID=2054316 RepID=UPI0025728D42|nr:alpha/beta hydrolase [Thalassotalea atypica]